MKHPLSNPRIPMLTSTDLTETPQPSFVEKTGKNGIMLEAICFIPKETAVLDFSKAVESVQTYQTVQTGSHRHVLGETLAKLNHSCAPSLIVDTVKSECRAARDIYPGEELNFFYPSTEWTMEEPFLCSCSSPKCIGQIRGAAFLEEDQLKEHWLNPHIQYPRQAASTLPSLSRSPDSVLIEACIICGSGSRSTPENSSWKWPVWSILGQECNISIFR